MVEAISQSEAVRVLVVDDSPDDIAIVRRHLAQYQRMEFEVLSAPSASQGLERLERDGVDVVLLDYSLPGEDGVSFLRRLSSSTNRPPVILFSGCGDERLAVEAIRSGASDYFPKDAISPSALGEALRRALEEFHSGEEYQRLDEQIMVALAAAAENKDATTSGHLQRLASYAMLLGQELGLDDGQLRVLRYGALLHDIGKLAVSVKVLCKPGPLAEDEWEEMRQHPVVGERICSFMWFSRQVAPIIRHHHERWDGSGYVDGLAGPEIPLLARVVSVVDAFDAMSSDRLYRKALPVQEVLRRLNQGAGKQWDPEITSAFAEIVRRQRLPRFEGPVRRLRNAA